MKENTKRFWRRLLLTALVLHILFLLSRLPGQVYGKRFRKMKQWVEAGGDFGWRTWGEQEASRRALSWLLANTAPDTVIPYEEEILADPRTFTHFYASLPPRLLVKAKAVPDPARGYRGRPVARGTLPDGSEGWIYVVRRGDQMVLEAR